MSTLDIVLISVLLLLIIALCALCGVLAYIAATNNFYRFGREKPLKRAQGEKKPISKEAGASEAEKLAEERRKREISNFFNYTGDAMPKPEETNLPKQ